MTTPDNLSLPIFKRDTAGKIRTWQYEFEGDSYRTIAGIKDGNLVKSGWTKCEAKNEGRSNATTAEQQAIAEAVAEEDIKLKREYRRTIAELDAVKSGPMLAQDYAKLKKPLVFPVFSQPKLDGIRAIISKDGALSRTRQPHYNAEHILEALAPIFLKHPDLVLDGEFYNHDLKADFNKIVSVVRKQNPDAEQRAEASKLIQYHVYDCPSHAGGFVERFLFLKNEVFLDGEFGPIKFVLTSRAEDQGDLDAFNGLYTEQGYEGQMVRLDLPYDFDTRSKALLKRKEFQTDEFPITDVIEGLGNWGGYAKAVEFMLPDDKRLPDGSRPKSGIRGSQEEMRKLLDRQRTGTAPKSATIRYFGYTEDGALRFPVVIDFHDEARVD